MLPECSVLKASLDVLALQSLFDAASEGDAVLTKHLLKKGTPPNAMDPDGDTPLICAAQGALILQDVALDNRPLQGTKALPKPSSQFHRSLEIDLVLKCLNAVVRKGSVLANQAATKNA